jgi:hypothetical protein
MNFALAALAMVLFMFLTVVAGMTVYLVIMSLFQRRRRRIASECLESFYFREYSELEDFLCSVGILFCLNYPESSGGGEQKNRGIEFSDLNLVKFSLESLSGAMISVLWNHKENLNERCLEIAKIISFWNKNKRGIFLKMIKNSSRHGENFSDQVVECINTSLHEFMNEAAHSRFQRKVDRVVGWYS